MDVASWRLLIYRLPPQPSRPRVAIWRELRRLGALPLQQSVVIVPDAEPFATVITGITERIGREGGTSYAFLLANLPAEQHTQLVRDWNALRDHEYAEIIEECETRFRKEIEFEIFRNNLTGSEAEEIEVDLEKIRSWLARVAARDIFGAHRRREAEDAVKICEELLDDFNQRVFMAEAEQGGMSLDIPASVSWSTLSEVTGEQPPLDDADVQPGSRRRSDRPGKGG
jgi:hypothetical protein